MRCKNCGTEVADEVTTCPKCGELLIKLEDVELKEKKDSTVAWMLWLFLGSMGIHAFYLNRNKRGIAYLILGALAWPTLGLTALIMGILWIVDATQINKWVARNNAQL